MDGNKEEEKKLQTLREKGGSLLDQKSSFFNLFISFVGYDVRDNQGGLLAAG
jgi:hypothetical protein